MIRCRGCRPRTPCKKAVVANPGTPSSPYFCLLFSSTKIAYRNLGLKPIGNLEKWKKFHRMNDFPIKIKVFLFLNEFRTLFYQKLILLVFNCFRCEKSVLPNDIAIQRLRHDFFVGDTPAIKSYHAPTAPRRDPGQQPHDANQV